MIRIDINPGRISETAYGLFLALAVFTLSLAVSSNHFHTIDEGSMFVTAINIMDRGELHSNQLGWAQWANHPGQAQGQITESGDVYSKKSWLVIALIIPLLALGRFIPALGLTRAVLLLGPLLFALTATLLYRFARGLGFSRTVGTLATGAFALSTMALVYSKLAIGEAVSSFGLLIALFALNQIWADHSPAEMLCGAGLALAVGANAAYVLLVPVFVLALIAPTWRTVSLRQTAARLARFSVPLAAVGAALAAYNYARFGSVLQTGRHFAPGQEGFTTPLWWAVPGLTISPARGFFWYNPPALLAFFSWPRFHRAHRALSWMMIALVLSQLFIFGAWWEWWGGYGWGPRFLLPLVPLVILACLPLFETVARRGSKLLTRLIVGAILAAGFAVQIAGAAIDFNIYESELDTRYPEPAGQPRLYHHDPSLVFDIPRSPIVVHFQRLNESPLDFAWAADKWSPPSIPSILSKIDSQKRAGDSIVYLVPELIDPLLAAPELPPVFGLPVNVPPADDLANRLFARARRGADRVWLITWYGAGDPGNWYEAQLREQWASVSEEFLDGYRTILFARPPRDVVPRPIAYSFGSIQLTDYAARSMADTFFVELQWQATAALDQDYVTFVHVVGEDGALIAGQDRQPLGGYRPTGRWAVGKAVVDRFAFSLAADQLAGARVEVGWYAWPSLERLPLADSSGRRIEGDALALEMDR